VLKPFEGDDLMSDCSSLVRA